jgi:hypothetical protein
MALCVAARRRFGGAFDEFALCVTTLRSQARSGASDQSNGRERNDDLPHFTSPLFRGVERSPRITQRTLHLSNVRPFGLMSAIDPKRTLAIAINGKLHVLFARLATRETHHFFVAPEKTA